MTQTEALEILRKESGCRKEEDSCVGFDCGKCEHFVPYNDFTHALDIAISALEQVIEREDDLK